MATHSSVLAWRIPGTGEPGGLPSVGSHRVGHDRSDLALACLLDSHAPYYHLLLLLSCFSRAQLCVTLWTIAHQALLSVGFSRQEYCRVPCPPPGDLPNTGIEPRPPALQADSLPLIYQGSPITTCCCCC